MAQARLSRPSTPAGALDTYVKAVLSDNGVYLAAVTPQDEQGALWRQLEGADGFHLGLSAPLEDSGCPWIRSNRVTRYQAQWRCSTFCLTGKAGYRGLWCSALRRRGPSAGADGPDLSPGSGLDGAAGDPP